MHFRCVGPSPTRHAQIATVLRGFVDAAHQVDLATIRDRERTTLLLSVPPRWATFVATRLLARLQEPGGAPWQPCGPVQPRPTWTRRALVAPRRETDTLPVLPAGFQGMLTMRWTTRGCGGLLQAAPDAALDAALTAAGWQVRPIPARAHALVAEPRWVVRTTLVPIGWVPVLDAPLTAPVAPAPTVPSVPDASDQADANDEADAITQRLLAQIAPLLEVDPEADDAILSLFAPSAPSAGAKRQTDGDPVPDDDGDVLVITADDDAIDGITWPAGPGPMRPADVAYLVTEVRTSPICGGQTPGITRKRLAQILPEQHTEYSRQLMVWLAAADVLDPPRVASEPFRNPRPLLADLDDATLAERLAATPVPTLDDARAVLG